MIKKFGKVLFVAALIITGFWKIVAVQAVHNQPEPAQPQGGQQNDGPAFFLVSYDTKANLNQGEVQLYQNMVNLLNGYANVPQDRLNYFSALNNANGCTITGWQGYISNVQPNCNGYAVTISITPTLASNTYGQAAVVYDSDYS